MLKTEIAWVAVLLAFVAMAELISDEEKSLKKGVAVGIGFALLARAILGIIQVASGG